MDPVIVRFWTYDPQEEAKSLAFALLIQPDGEFEVVEGECPAATMERLGSEPITAPPATAADLARPMRKVLPRDGLTWAQALSYHYSGRHFWANRPQPAPDQFAPA